MVKATKKTATKSKRVRKPRTSKKTGPYFEKHVFGPIAPRSGQDFTRADLEVYGLNHFRPSYVARVFFNDDEVEPATAHEGRESYAGDFSIFGHDRCFGGDGHCHLPKARRRFDDRPSHPLTPAFRRVVVTGALRRALRDSAELSITLIVASGQPSDRGKLLDCSDIKLVTFR